MEKLKLYVGKETPESKHDTFRELLDLWDESDFIDIIRHDSDYFTWVGGIGDILLYEYDRWDTHFPGLPNKWNHALFACDQHAQGDPIFYWARHPRKIEEKIQEGIKTYDERNIESIFLGKSENLIQLRNRTKENWEIYIEEFNMDIKMGDSFNWRYSQDKYLDKISRSRFGLDLAGFGRKTNRLIEYFALGVVPLVAPEVCMEFYDSPVEGVHYFRVSNGEDIYSAIEKCSKSKWEAMSEAGKKWYEKNCSREGSFKTTCEILSGLK